MIKAIFGKVRLNLHTCPNCENDLLNNSLLFTCDVCGYSNKDEKAKTFKVVVPPPGMRKIPPRALQKILLKVQSNKCFWCGNKLGSLYWKNGKVKTLEVHWDHKIPFSYTQTNRNDNWVASCNICNLFKSNFLFTTDKECREYLSAKWQEAIHKEIISID